MIPADGYRIRFTDGTSTAWVANVHSAEDLRRAEYDAGDQIGPRKRLDLWPNYEARIRPEVYVDGRWYDPMYASIRRRDGEDHYEHLLRVIAATHDAACPSDRPTDDESDNWWRNA